MDIKCLDCKTTLVEGYDIYEQELYMKEIPSPRLYLKCPKCGAEYIPEIILHRRIKNIKVSISMKLPEE